MYSRFGVLVEAALFRVAIDVPALRQLLFVHRILSTSISFDQTDDHQKQEEQRNRAHHPNEPRGISHIILRVAVDCCKRREVSLSIQKSALEESRTGPMSRFTEFNRDFQSLIKH